MGWRYVPDCPHAGAVGGTKKRPGILATLYNLGYQKYRPNKNPSMGGFDLPVIIDGRLVQHKSFGEKVAMLYYESQMMRAFRDGALP